MSGSQYLETTHIQEDPDFYQKWFLQNYRFNYSFSNEYPAPSFQKKSADNQPVPFKNEDSPLFKLIRNNIIQTLYHGNHDEELTCKCVTVHPSIKCSNDRCSTRKLLAECSALCTGNCQNKRIQKKMFSDEDLFIDTKTEYGFCISTPYPIASGSFIAEYVGDMTLGQMHRNQSDLKTIALYDYYNSYSINYSI